MGLRRFQRSNLKRAPACHRDLMTAVAAKFEARMKRGEAKRLVLLERHDWAAKHVPSGQQARGTDGLIFFGYLQRRRPDLLEFKASGDRWVTVHGWLAREGKIIRTEPP